MDFWIFSGTEILKIHKSLNIRKYINLKIDVNEIEIQA